MCIYICIYIYIYGKPPHELPTLVLYRKYRVKPAFPAGPDSVSLKDYRKQTQISRERVSHAREGTLSTRTGSACGNL